MPDQPDLDMRVRMAAMARLSQLRVEGGGVVRASQLEGGFEFENERIALWSAQKGIWKPKQLNCLNVALKLVDAPRREYQTVVVKRRVHQHRFRELVLNAYKRRCRICELRHASWMPIESFWMIDLRGFGERDSVRQRRQSHPQRRSVRPYALVKRKHRQLAKRFVEHECRCEVQGIKRAYGFNRKLCSRAFENAFGEIVHIPARFRPVQYLQGGQFVCSRNALRGARAG